MDSQFSILGTSDRLKAMTVIQDYAETTYFPEKLDEVLHYLLHQQYFLPVLIFDLLQSLLQQIVYHFLHQMLKSV
mgnify:CR=1 FL=1